MNTSEEVRNIMADYALWMSDRLGMDGNFMLDIGMKSKPLLDAEFAMVGVDMYKNSVILPMRNLAYSAGVMDSRADYLDTLKLKSPILDYGCGVGFTLLYLKMIGHKDLWAYDIPGVQANLASEYLDLHGIRWGIPDKPGTVMCNNVLEHAKHPMVLLGTLRSMGGNLMANCCDSDDIDHISSRGERLKVIASLQNAGEWCDYRHGTELSWMS